MEYFVAIAGNRQGPFTLANLVARGLSPDTPVWKSGTHAWVRADQIPEVYQLLSRLPPPLPVEATIPSVIRADDRAATVGLGQQLYRSANVGSAASGMSQGFVILIGVGGLVLLLICMGVGGALLTSARSSSARTAAPHDHSEAPLTDVVAMPRLNISGHDGTAELQELCQGMSQKESIALGLGVILTGVDAYGARITIRNTGNVPVRFYPENLMVHFGADAVLVTTINHPLFLQRGVLPPGQSVSGLVMYRARIDIGAAMRLAGGGLSYTDDSIRVDYGP